MSYTLDLTTDPPPPPPNPADPKARVVPLFRRTFSTSRYASIDALAAELRGSKVLHRPLRAAIGGLPAGLSARATDQEIQDALSASGEETLPAPGRGLIKIYWIKKPAATAYTPHAILVDSIEPIWRSRIEPKMAALDPADPAFEIVTPQHVDWLKLAGDANVSRIVASTAGTRSVVFLNDLIVGGKVSLSLVVAASQVYTIAAATKPLIDLPMGATAPWEDDEP
jgi:hypothetical protein